MKIRIQNRGIVLVVAFTIVLAAGNPLFAQDQETVGLVPAADLDFIKADPRGVATEVVTVNRGRHTGLISAADTAFISRPFYARTGRQAASTTPERVGLISIADYRFIAGEEVPDVFAVYNDLSDSLTGGLAK